MIYYFFFFSSRRRHTRLQGDWSSDVCSSDLVPVRSGSRSGSNGTMGLKSTAPRTSPGRRKSRLPAMFAPFENPTATIDRKSTRLNSSHLVISYAVFCLKKKNKQKATTSKRQG